MTEYEDLRKGLENIESVVADQTLKMKELVKDHFHEFVQCKETIDNIHMMVTSTGNKSEESRKLIDQTRIIIKKNNCEMNSQMLEEMKRIETQANQLYGPLLTRTREAQRIQSTISSLKQPYSQFIFTLPQLIKHNEMMRNFDQVVRLYRRAMNLKKQVHFSKNAVFKDIMSQVDRTISLLRGSLLDQLKQSDTFGEEQDRIIHYLMELDSKDDPALYCLMNTTTKFPKCWNNACKIIKTLSEPQKIHEEKWLKKCVKFLQRICHHFGSLEKRLLMADFEKFFFFFVNRQKFESSLNRHFYFINKNYDVGRNSSLKRRNNRQVEELFNGLAAQFCEHIKAAFDEMLASKPTHGSNYRPNRVGSMANLLAPPSDHARLNEIVKDNVTYLLNSYRALKSVRVPQVYSVLCFLIIVLIISLLNFNVRCSFKYLRQIDELMASITREYLHKLFQSTLQEVNNLQENEKWIPHKDIPVITSLPFDFEKIIDSTLTTVENIGVDILYDVDDQYRDKDEDGDEEEEEFVSFDPFCNNVCVSFFFLTFDKSGDDRRYSPTPEKYQGSDLDDYQKHSDDQDSAKHKGATQKSEKKHIPQKSDFAHKHEYQFNSKWLVPQIGCFFVESLKIFADVLHYFVFLSLEHESSMSQAKTGNQEEPDLPWYLAHILFSIKYKLKCVYKVIINKQKPRSDSSLNNEMNSSESNDRKLLIVLSNSMYTKDIVLERLWSRLLRNGRILAEEYQQIVELEKEPVNDLYLTLEEIIFDRYVRCKTLKLNHILDESLLCDGINWEMAPEPRGIRNHCLQLLLEIVFVHNEVYNRAKQELRSVLEGLVRKIADHMLTTIESIDRSLQ
ncbi:component of the exocyst complex [Reticulomyxa filosa]|uniref:Exocyst complex component n=1 Tax=Reticulomyxa filosa TaxID=46433 RepID=X6NEH6_RETFI|nr:component of the exocyst complex [Reticulomyxa filosa]|eukprot:ETO24293.1 component of the exocyst complex [Reticulomyxa filosa]